MGKRKTKEEKAAELESLGAATPVVSAKTEADEVKAVIMPMYEGAQVLEILQENTPEGFHHCRMSDETTKHVPVKLFSKQNEAKEEAA